MLWCALPPQVDLADVKPEDVRAITVLDFKRATKQARARGALCGRQRNSAVTGERAVCACAVQCSTPCSGSAGRDGWPPPPRTLLLVVQVRASVTKEDVAFHEEWNRAHGALSNDCAMGADDADDDW